MCVFLRSLQEVVKHNKKNSILVNIFPPCLELNKLNQLLIQFQEMSLSLPNTHFLHSFNMDKLVAVVFMYLGFFVKYCVLAVFIQIHRIT